MQAAFFQFAIQKHHLIRHTTQRKTPPAHRNRNGNQTGTTENKKNCAKAHTPHQCVATKSFSLSLSLRSRSNIRDFGGKKKRLHGVSFLFKFVGRMGW